MTSTEAAVPDSCLPREGEREQGPLKNILCHPDSTLGGTQLLKVSHMVVGVLMTHPREGIFLN
jgi:hypothetical protein